MNKEEYKIDTRANYMGAVHILLFSLAILACTVAILIASAYSTPMLVYNESDIYSCPHEAFMNHIDGHADHQGRSHYRDPFTHQIDEDFFYDPLACSPFY